MKNKLFKYTLLAITLLLSACGTNEEAPESTPTNEEAVEQPEEQAADTAGEVETTDEASNATIKMMYTAPHGNQSFASTFVVMDGDTVVDAFIDEYQFLEGNDFEGVPNDDKAFGEGYAEELKLSSKRENNEGYSAMMTEHANATTSYNDNLDAIQDFAKGKTLAEIEEAISELEGLSEDDPIADVVTGATFVDTSGYLQAIVDTANEGYEFLGAEGVDLSNAELSYSLEAPHGERSFAIVAVLHDEDTVLAAAMDELQFLDPADFEGVPNSDQTFGSNYAEGVVLASKIENTDAYSAMMEGAGSTVSYEDNMLAIINHVIGSTSEEIKAVSTEVEALGEDGNIADVVTGATFVDTAGYLEAIANTLED